MPGNVSMAIQPKLHPQHYIRQIPAILALNIQKLNQTSKVTLHE
jgi:hypothetical protein